MSRRARRALGCALLAVIAALAGAPAVLADYKESYRQGIVAVDNKDWPEVARLMRSAAGEQPKEGESVRIYGTRFLPYLPHFYLGLALFRQGDCEGALAQWKESENQGVVQTTARWNGLSHDREVCQKRVAAKLPGEPPPPRPPGPDPAEVAKAAQKAEAEKQAKIQADRLAETQARDRKAAEERDRKAAEERDRKAAEARDRQRQEEETRQAAARQEAEKQAQATRQAQAHDAALAKQGKELPPTELRTAARAFFRADYPEVVRTLGKATFAERRAQAAAHLLLAAARHALFIEGGEKNAELRRLALENVRACRRAAPRVAPDPRAFSPRFTEFWKTAG